MSSGQNLYWHYSISYTGLTELKMFPTSEQELIDGMRRLSSRLAKDLRIGIQIPFPVDEKRQEIP